MKKIAIICLLAVSCATLYAQGFLITNYVNLITGSYVQVNQPGGNTTGVRLDSIFNLKFQDETISLGTPPIKTVNFTGAGVAATRTGNTVNVTISGGGGSLVGAFKSATGAGSAPGNFYPYGTPTDSLYWLALNRGSLQMKKTSGSNTVMSDNGLNVYNDFKYIETDDDTLNWDAVTYNKALIEFEDVDVFVDEPTSLNSNWNSEVYVLEFRNISNVDSHFVRFDSLTYRTFNGNPMPDILVGAGGQYRSVAFKLEFAETGQLICMEDVEGGLDSAQIADLGFLVNGGNDGPVTVGSNDDVTTIESNNVAHITFGDSGGGFTDFNGDDLDGIEDIDIDGRIKQNMGASVANAADITLGSGNLFHLTGNGTINTISAAGWKAGSGFRLIIDGIATILAHGAVGSGVSMALPGATNYNCIQNEVIYLVYDGVSWFLQK